MSVLLFPAVKLCTGGMRHLSEWRPLQNVPVVLRFTIFPCCCISWLFLRRLPFSPHRGNYCFLSAPLQGLLPGSAGPQGLGHRRFLTLASLQVTLSICFVTGEELGLDWFPFGRRALQRAGVNHAERAHHCDKLLAYCPLPL